MKQDNEIRSFDLLCLLTFFITVLITIFFYSCSQGHTDPTPTPTPIATATPIAVPTPIYANDDESALRALDHKINRLLFIGLLCGESADGTQLIDRECLTKAMKCMAKINLVKPEALTELIKCAESSRGT